MLEVTAFLLSICLGLWLSAFNPGMGPVASISIIGAFLIHILKRKE